LVWAEELRQVMDSAAVKAWVADVSRSSVNGKTMTGVTYYRGGDFTGVHTDVGTGPINGLKRRVAFVLHLAKEWQPTFGGDLVFMHPPSFVHPSFNEVTLFPLTKDAWHFVSPVAPSIDPRFKRITFGGWWMSSNASEATEMETRFRDDPVPIKTIG
jgi:Rps23 Pro-64 3,4-dihydroxylase Tpa1-like proline 4-hydroxylase